MYSVENFWITWKYTLSSGSTAAVSSITGSSEGGGDSFCEVNKPVEHLYLFVSLPY